MKISLEDLFRLNRNINIEQIFSSSEELKRMIAVLIHAGVRLDRDENHVKTKYLSLYFNEYPIGFVAIGFL